MVVEHAGAGVAVDEAFAGEVGVFEAFGGFDEFEADGVFEGDDVAVVDDDAFFGGEGVFDHGAAGAAEDGAVAGGVHEEQAFLGHDAFESAVGDLYFGALGAGEVAASGEVVAVGGFAVG